MNGDNSWLGACSDSSSPVSAVEGQKADQLTPEILASAHGLRREQAGRACDNAGYCSQGDFHSASKLIQKRGKSASSLL